MRQIGARWWLIAGLATGLTIGAPARAQSDAPENRRAG